MTNYDRDWEAELNKYWGDQDSDAIADNSDWIGGDWVEGYPSDEEYPCTGVCQSQSSPEPPAKREWVVTATIQFVVEAEYGSWAMGTAKDQLNEFIAQGYAPNDPLNGAVIDDVRELGAGEV